MSRNETKINKEVKSAIDLAIKKFLDDGSKNEYKFPSSLSSQERKYIHCYAPKLGLQTRSFGVKEDRYLTLFKCEDITIVNESYFDLKDSSKFTISSIIKKFPLTFQECLESSNDKPKSHAGKVDLFFKELNCTIGRLGDVIPQIPTAPNYNSNPALTCFRQSLPIFQLKKEIIDLINKNQVVIISGETGCGKTTQVPQFILEDCMTNKKPCRIITSEPRRLAALSMADRVAEERGENVGQIVGYQIKLESKVSPKTLLTFCTHNVLLRTLMGGKNSFANMTHLVIDEIHERDRFSDFLLLTLKAFLNHQKHVKLILMSSTIDTEKFSKYFDDCQYISVSKLNYDVQVYFLSDILAATGYKSALLKTCDLRAADKSSQQKKLNEWCQEADILNQFQFNKKEPSSSLNSFHLFKDEKIIDSNYIKTQMDTCIQSAWIAGDDVHFQEILNLIINENYPIDYQHSKTGTTALIAAAYKGKLKFVETLLGLGADVKLRDGRDWDAFHWAQFLNHQKILDFFETYFSYHKNAAMTDTTSEELVESQKGQQLLEAYRELFPNEKEIDFELIMELIYNICVISDSSVAFSKKGTILVFLPGYNEIVALRDRFLSDVRFPPLKFTLFILHSQMQNSEQRKVFLPAKPGVRKLIFSTNLAETSITINDVVYVIDSGRVNEKVYDKILEATIFKSVWISQSSAIQRRGRAGRCQNGVCFHLFSKQRFMKMSKFDIPEILRMPIHELCLQSKLLAPKEMSIVDFLTKALDAPSISTINDSIELLKSIDALDQNEQLTEIGLHLLDLPVEPNLGKMILNAVVLKCLDPVLTIVCCLSYRDLFITCVDQNKKRAVNEARKKLSAGTFSDHMVFLRLFQQWQKSRNDGYEKSFLDQYCVRSATMEMIGGMRAQILGQLRASGFVRSRGLGNIRDLNVNSEKWAVVKAALTAGAYPNLVQMNRKGFISSKVSRVYFHPSSILQLSLKSKEPFFKKGSKLHHLFSPNWFIYQEMFKIGQLSYAQCCTIVSPISVALFAGNNRSLETSFKKDSKASNCVFFSKLDSDSESEDKSLKEKSLFKVDDWIFFKLDPNVANLVYQLKMKWRLLFLRKMRSPSKQFQNSDESIIKCIVDIITEEEEVLGIQQPVGIGQRPKPISINFYSFGNV